MAALMVILPERGGRGGGGGGKRPIQGNACRYVMNHSAVPCMVIGSLEYFHQY